MDSVQCPMDTVQCPYIEPLFAFGLAKRKDIFHCMDMELVFLKINKNWIFGISAVVSQGSNLMRGRLIEGNTEGESPMFTNRIK